MRTSNTSRATVLVADVNVVRRALDLQQLTPDADLDAAAVAWATTVAAGTVPSGPPAPAEIGSIAGEVFVDITANAYIGAAGGQDVIDAWLDRPVNADRLLIAAASRVGTAWIQMTTETVVVAQVYARRADDERPAWPLAMPPRLL